MAQDRARTPRRPPVHVPALFGPRHHRSRRLARRRPYRRGLLLRRRPHRPRTVAPPRLRTFVWGDEPTNYIHRMQDVLFLPYRTTDVLQSGISSETTTVLFPADNDVSGKFIFCETEILKVLGTNQSGSNLVGIVSRGEFGTEPQPHVSGSPFFVLTSTAQQNIDTAEGKIISLIHDIRSIPSVAVPGIRFQPCPVLYVETDSMFVAGSVDLVNSLVAGSLVYMPDPGCDLFRNAVLLPGKRFIGGPNTWEFYHCLMGELHCGSEAERVLPHERPFWKEFRGWPYERKEISP